MHGFISSHLPLCPHVNWNALTGSRFSANIQREGFYAQQMCMCFHPCGVHYLALQVAQKIAGDIGGLVVLIYREFLNMKCMNLAVIVVPLQLLILFWISNHFKMKVPAQSNTWLVLNLGLMLKQVSQKNTIQYNYILMQCMLWKQVLISYAIGFSGEFIFFK